MRHSGRRIAKSDKGGKARKAAAPTSPTASSQESGGVISVLEKFQEKPLSSYRLSTRLANVLRHAKFEVLGDLHGQTYEALRQYRNFGEVSKAELRHIVERLKRGHEPEIRDSFRIPEHSRQVAVADLVMSVRLTSVLATRNIRYLGQLEGLRVESFRELWQFGYWTEQELLGIVKRTQAGEFKEYLADMSKVPMSKLLPLMDSLIVALPDRAREMLLVRLGASGGRPLTLGEIGLPHGRTKERVRQIIKENLELLLKQGGPKLDHLLRKIGTECRKQAHPLTPKFPPELWRKGTPAKYHPAFYVRMIECLSPTIPIRTEDNG